MREYIFTDHERELLNKWLKTGKEDNQTQKLFTRMRRINQRLVNDLKLFLAVRKKLNEQQRWRLNVSKDYVRPYLEEHDSTPTEQRSTTSNASKTSGDK